MRLVCVSGQQGTQDVTEMSFKQATDVFRTAGRPVTLTLSLPDQQGSQLQVSADEQAQLQSALEKLQALQAQAVMVAKSNGAAPPHTADAQGAGGFDWDGGWGPQSPGISRRGFAAVEEGLPPAQSSAQPHSLKVTCPEGVREGQRLIVTAPDGSELETVVPIGVFSGDEFEIRIGE